MLLTYPTFYRRYGVRMISQLAIPPLTDLKLLELPLGSAYHFTPFDGVEVGPSSSDYLFRNITKPILTSHILELGADKGAPRKIGANIPTMIRDYHARNRRMRLLKNLDTAQRDKTSLLVYNYGFLAKEYRYVRSFLTEYHRWYNEFGAVTKNIAEVTEKLDHQNYIFTGVPKVIPSLGQLATACVGLTQALLKIFKGPESFLMIELWKWLGPQRHTSLFAAIPTNKLSLVNIVYQESSKWSVLNLGVLDSFRNNKSDQGVDVNAPKRPGATLNPDQTQKRMLRMMMTLMEVRTLTANTDTPDPSQAPTKLNGTTTMSSKLMGSDDDLEEIDPFDMGDSPQDEEETPAFPDEPEIASVPEMGQIDEDEETAAKRIADEDTKLDEDLAQLNEIAQRQEDEAVEGESALDHVVYENKDNELEDGILSVCDRLADDGLLSASEYKRFTKLASLYKTLPAPSGGRGTLGEFINIAPEVLKIDKSSSVPDSDTILDKSMLKSSLLDFDERYIEKVMAKDTAAMVLNMQKAGVAITGYSVERVNDVLGGYEMHRVRLTPVVGQQSTVHFKLPLVNPDGTYTSNGVKYRLRKQRGDLPIRKTGPARVALTSYYGKAFVNRSSKKANDYGHWLQCQVMLKGLSKEDQSITNMVVDNVFDPGLECPRAFSAIAGAVKSLQARGYSLFFDVREKERNYPPSAISAYEKNGNLLLGKNATGYLLIDKGGTVYTVAGNDISPFGSIEQFLNLPTQTAPVESASVVVFGKEIPVGVVLGYHLGFEKLMRLLNVQPRRVSAGARLNLQSHEYALTFSDETLIFSRDDRFASMVLAGFNDYHRATKLFSVYSFDKRGVYLNLLEANGLGTRFVRELDLMYRMFVDPITKDLLIEMKEPTTLQGLLLRSCEMLMEDKTPDELDPAYMRIKGYERMSGAVYTELIQSLRGHNSRLGKSNAPIELNPYAVWKRISEDPLKSQVGEINPIKSIKEMEAVTYAGTGGRNKRSMTKRTRAYHPNDMGTISESTVDSSDVGINIFMCADPQFTSLRGISKRYDMNKKEATSLLSTSALLGVGCDRDDQ